MNLRKTIPAAIVVGGLIILLLAFLGVFARRPGDFEPPVPDTAAETAEPGAGLTMVARGFRAEGDNWILTAPEARIEGERRVRLTRPKLLVWQDDPDSGDRVETTADVGIYLQPPDRNISMSGNVVIRHLVDQETVLYTESLEVDPDENTGYTDGDVKIIAATEEGRHVITGKGGAFSYSDRTARIRENIRMEVAGAAPLFAVGQPRTAEQKPTTPTVITCRGPCNADGFKRTVAFESDVVVRQDAGELMCAELHVAFGEETRTHQRITAKGDVRFKSQDAEGRCDRLVRTETGGQMVLDGRPAKVRQGTSNIEAARITMHSTTGRIFVPVRGKVVIAQEKPDGSAEHLNVLWSQNMELDRADQRAFFRGDVRFDYGPQEIECERLTIRFDKDGKEMVSCHAEDHVRVRARIQPSPPKPGRQAPEPRHVTAEGDDMVYTPRDDSIVLSGKAKVDQSGQSVRGERIELKESDGSLNVRGTGSLETSPEKASNAQPMRVEWTGEMAYDQSSRKAAFRRDVVLDQGTRKLSARRLDANFGENNALETFEAAGDVLMEEDILKGKSRRKLRARKLVGTAGDSGALKAFEATGSVVLEEGALTETEQPRILRTDWLTATVGMSNELELIKTRGPTSIEDQGSTAIGDRLVWNLKNDFGTLSGEPVELRQGQQRIFGDVIQFARERGHFRITSRYGIDGTLIGAQDLSSSMP